MFEPPLFENIYFWIIFGIMLAIIIMLAIKLVLTSMFYFSKMEFSQALIKKVKIPSADIEMNARIILPKDVLDENNQPSTKLPLIFFNPGWMMDVENKMLWQYAVALALGGPYAVLLYECRGHGKTPGKRILGSKILEDIPRIIDYGEKLEFIDPDRLGFAGISFGGMAALTRAYEDKRIKAIVSAVSPHNAKVNFSRKPKGFADRMSLFFLHHSGVNPKNISDESNKYISPEFIIEKNNPDLNKRVCLIGSKNDSAISFDEVKKNLEALNLPDDQTLILEKAGHTLIHQELIILATMLRFFKKML